VKRLAHTIVFTHAHPVSLTDDLAARLEASLRRTAAFGYTEARKELRALRAGEPRAQYVLPDAGDHASAVEGGMPGVRALLKRRARQAADHVTRAVQAEAVKQQGEDKLLAVASAAKAGARALHNSVLELVGETLNLGRTAGAMSHGPAARVRAPQRAARQEHLRRVRRGCTARSTSSAPTRSTATARPAECYGGGRCRGHLWIFGDTADQMSVAEAA
jgi:hypothetical protein